MGCFFLNKSAGSCGFSQYQSDASRQQGTGTGEHHVQVRNGAQNSSRSNPPDQPDDSRKCISHSGSAELMDRHRGRYVLQISPPSLYKRKMAFEPAVIEMAQQCGDNAFRTSNSSWKGRHQEYDALADWRWGNFTTG